MKAIKVNADYESVLFNNKPLPIINEALEFLALFTQNQPIISRKKYSDEYLVYVEDVTGTKPVIKSDGSAENWWGALTDIELEKKLNSKEMSTLLNSSDSFILNSMKDLPPLNGKTFLAKNPYGMSGQNFCKVAAGSLENLERMLKVGKVILEPLFDRVYDFSHFIFPNGMKVCYQNMVDQRFQYRGSVFKNYMNPVISELPFYSDIAADEWKRFELALSNIISHYHSPQIPSGFSIDSFVYKENGEYKIRHLSEVNYRRTMGQVAFELTIKFGGRRRWSAFILSKASNLEFAQMREKLSPIEWTVTTSRGVMLLSPGNVRYDMFFLSAADEMEGKILLNELKQLLPDSEFAIEL